MISFIIPAHNEEKLIGRTIESIQSAAKSADGHAPPFEILVVDDASTDATSQVADQAGARVISIHRRHIAAARNAGAAAARGDVFVFVDADTTVTADVYRATLAALRDGAVGGGSLVEFDPPVPLYARSMLPLAMWVNRTFHMAAGCYVYATRAAFTAVGGFDEAHFAGEETIFSRAMKKVGRFHVVDASVMTSGRKLRAHSAMTIFGTMLKLVALALFRRRAFANREHFDLWYAPRRADPKEQASQMRS
jgi:glycosyltransferase involved in cell wall biosynthesis